MSYVLSGSARRVASWVWPEGSLLERLNEEITQRTWVVRIFPNPGSCLRLIRALCAEPHEAWLKDHRYLNMDFLKEQKKDLLQVA